MKCPGLTPALVITDNARLAAQVSCVLARPGYYVPAIRTFDEALGGPEADLHSHCNVALGVLNHLWNGDVKDLANRARATGILLAAITRARFKDYPRILGYLAAAGDAAPGLLGT